MIIEKPSNIYTSIQVVESTLPNKYEKISGLYPGTKEKMIMAELIPPVSRMPINPSWVIRRLDLNAATKLPMTIAAIIANINGKIPSRMPTETPTNEP